MAGLLLAPAPSYAIPSPELIVGSIGSFSQIGAVISALVGGGAAFAAVRTGGNARNTRWLWRSVLGLLALSVGLIGLNIYQWQAAKREHWQMLSATLTRPSRLPGQPKLDTTLKELSPKEQASSPLGMSTEDAQRIIAEGPKSGYQVLDIREKAEVEMGTFKHAVPIRYPELLSKGYDFKGRKALLICHNGNRSSETCQMLAARGIDCHFIVGGLERWITEGRSADGFYRSSLTETRAVPAYPNDSRLLDTTQARRLIEDEGANIVDVRYPGAFAAGHLPGAINLPMRRMMSDALNKAIDALPDKPTIVPCYDRRSCFFGQLVGLELYRKGRDFRGRYTVPWLYVPTEPVPAHVKAYLAERNLGIYGHAVHWLAGVLDRWSREFGFLAVLIGLAVLSRLLILPFAVKAERDQIVAKTIEPQVSSLKARLVDDPLRRGRALQELYRRHGMTPILNLVALLGLPILAMASSAIAQAARTGGYAWPFFGPLAVPDHSFILPIICGVLIALYLDVVMATTRRQRLLCWLLGLPAMTALMAILPAAIAAYVAVSLVLIVLQRLIVSGVMAWRARARQPQRKAAHARSRNRRGIVPLALAGGLDGVGGKARRLGEMLDLGLPVPDGVVLTPEFIRSWQGAPQPGRARLERKLRRAVGRGPLAVRSTAEGEDGADASHAGIFESVTDVAGPDVAGAVDRVLASYRSERMRHYAQESGEMAGGVVVQRMITAEYAGVLFTRAPDAAGATLVEMVAGAGEALVSGEQTPNAYRFGRRSDLAMDEGASPIDLGPLLSMGRKLERTYGRPQDVEWVYADGAFSIVQSRDITTGVAGVTEAALDEWERVLDLGDANDPHAITFARNELSEMLPAPTPVSLSLVEAIYGAGGSVDHACRRLGLTYGAGEEAPAQFPVFFGRLYIDIVEQRARAPRLTEGRVRKLLKSAPAMEERFRAETLQQLAADAARAAAVGYRQLETGQLISEFRDLVTALVEQQHVEAEIINIVADLAMSEARKAFTTAGLEPASYLVPNRKTMLEQAVNDALQMSLPDRQPTLRRILGSRSRLDYELSAPRFGEVPEELRKFVDEQSTLASLHQHHDLKPLADPELAHLTALACTMQVLKEDAKNAVLGNFAALRKALLALDERLGFDGEIFFLTLPEIIGLSEAHVQQARERARERAEARENLMAIRALPRDLSLAALERASWPGGRAGNTAGGLSGMRVAGSGEPTGRAYVVSDDMAEAGDELSGFQPGDILVTPFVHPAWLGHVLDSAGVVSATGGWLSHMAIVARERDIPMVVAVDGWSQIEHGSAIRIGAEGQIHIETSIPAEPDLQLDGSV
ncbi:MAG: PEP/pyruvate-binding domain-containing protein [Hyphomicrobiaceae bacterium]